MDGWYQLHSVLEGRVFGIFKLFKKYVYSQQLNNAAARGTKPLHSQKSAYTHSPQNLTIT